jgi:hypothetical protein
MTVREAVLEREKNGWRVLASSGDAAITVYRDVLHDDVEMLLPGGLRLRGSLTSCERWALNRGRRS